MKNTQKISAVCILAALAGTSSAQFMAVDQNLGTLGFGSYNLTGSNAALLGGVAEAYEASNNGTTYRTYRAQEYVYQFTTTGQARFRLTNNLSDITADYDYFLLNDLFTIPEALDTGIWELALGGLAFVDGDFGTPTEFFAGNYPAGTYYLSIDEFTGGSGTLSPIGGPFDIVLEIIPFTPGEPPASINLGTLGGSGSYDINTFGSSFDTELGLYNSSGTLLANNDDTGGLQSQVILNLGEGTYYIALGGYNTGYGSVDFDVTPGSASGGYILTVNGQVESSGSHASATVTWFSFVVSDGGPAVCLGDIADDFGLTADEGGGPDGVVDFGDFAALLGLIGPCSGGTPGCLGDIADDFGLTADEGGGPDGVVDFGDFAALLGLIGPCP